LLDQETKKILKLKYIDNLKFNEIANKLGVTPQAASKNHKVAINKLRSLLLR
jgi:RNA polymerase sigma factor (sigma-70 family)